MFLDILVHCLSGPQKHMQLCLPQILMIPQLSASSMKMHHCNHFENQVYKTTHNISNNLNKIKKNPVGEKFKT